MDYTDASYLSDSHNNWSQRSICSHAVR